MAVGLITPLYGDIILSHAVEWCPAERQALYDVREKRKYRMYERERWGDWAEAFKMSAFNGNTVL